MSWETLEIIAVVLLVIIAGVRRILPSSKARILEGILLTVGGGIPLIILGLRVLLGDSFPLLANSDHPPWHYGVFLLVFVFGVRVLWNETRRKAGERDGRVRWRRADSPPPPGQGA